SSTQCPDPGLTGACMKTWFKLTAAAFAVAATSASHAAGTECLDVRLSSASPVVTGDVDVHVDVAVTNQCRTAVQVLRWQLHSDRGTHGSGAQSMHSAAATYLWTQGRNEKLDAASADDEAATTMRANATAAAASISYTGSCTSSQKSSLASAVTAATNYSVSS